MRQEPTIDRRALIETIGSVWGFAAADLRFVPSGEYGYCYAFDAAGAAWLAKIWPEPRPGYVSTESTLTMLTLTQLLYDRDAFRSQPPPVPTAAGDLAATFGGRLLALFPFVRGAPPAESAGFATAFGRQIAALQAATPVVADVPLRRESLDIPFAAALPGAFDFLERIGPGDRANRRAARALMLPYRDEVLAELDRLDALQRAVRAIDAPFVLCHRDIGAHNIIADDAGHLFFIDWDDVALAPPEHDLFFARGPWFDTALAAYFDAGGTRALSRDRFAFVHLRRVLDDMSFRLQTIMRDQTGETEAHEVYGLEKWVVPAWRDRAQDFAEMTVAFDRAGVAR